MIHIHGFVHCDPHAGNLGVVPVSNTVFDKMLLTVSTVGYASMIPLMLLVGLAEPGSIPSLVGGITAIVMTAVSGLSRLFLTEKQNHRHSFANTANGKLYEVVIYDHGMYRRLEPSFRTGYCKLWKSLLLRDSELGQKAVSELGVPEKYYDALAMIFTFRPKDGQGSPGDKLAKHERDKVRERYKDIGADDVNTFLRGLPRDLLFVLRSTNIVRSINLSLGGTARSRIYVMATSAVHGMEVSMPVDATLQGEIKDSVPVNGAYRINLPVTSEIVDTNTITYRQAFEIWRLHTYLSLMDSSWWLLANFLKLL